MSESFRSGRGVATSPEVKKSLLDLILEAVLKGCRKTVVCKYLDIPIRTVQRWKKYGLTDRRKGASKHVHNKLTARERSEIVETACSKRFLNLTPHAIVPILAEEGKYIASVSSFYRVLNDAKLLFNKRKGHSKKRKIEQVELKATSPYEIISWDISWLKTNIKGKYYYLYMFVDLWSRYIVGWQVYESESGELARELFNKIASKFNAKGTVLHSDNGGPMISSTMRATLEKLGVIASFSRPSVSNDNAYSESLFKTLKYVAGYPEFFKSISHARDWVESFVQWYNYEHKHSGIGYVTPYEKLTGMDKEIFKKRNEAFERAKKENPKRWSGRVKIWESSKEVLLKKGNYNKKVS